MTTNMKHIIIDINSLNEIIAEGIETLKQIEEQLSFKTKSTNSNIEFTKKLNWGIENSKDLADQLVTLIKHTTILIDSTK